MNRSTSNSHNKPEFETRNKQLARLLNRSRNMRNSALVLINITGCLLMLSPLLTLTIFSSSALYLYNSIQGPLDWFLFEIALTLTAFSAYLSWQLLNIHPQQPEGIKLQAHQSPELFSMLERRASHFRFTSIQQVTISAEVEHRVKGTPIGPIPLVHRYTLCTGIPLLFFISRDQFRLALAGAVAAAANRRSCLSGWLEQAAEDWPLIIKALQTSNTLLSKLLLKPAQWLATKIRHINQTAQPDWLQQQSLWMLDHSDEQSTADYLSNHLVAADFLNKQYWPMIFKAAERCPAPVVKAFSHLPLLLERILNKEQAERWLLQAQTAGKNQHAGIRDLLAELDLEHLHWPGLPANNAFDALFENNEILKQLDSHWQTRIKPEWHAAHTQYKNDALRFSQLKTRALEQGLRGKSALAIIKLAPRFVGEPDALSIYEKIYQHNTDDATVCFSCGQAFLRSSNTNMGIHALERAATLEPALAKRAHAMITEHRQAWANADQICLHSLPTAATA